MAIQNFPSAWMNDEHRMLADAASRYFREQWVPRSPAWKEAGLMPRETWREAGAQGFLCAAMPEAYGGGGGDFGHEAVLIMEAARANLSCFGGGLHSGIVAPYLLHHGSEEQKRRWLPKLATGELVGAIAMTEPGTGSDLQGIATHALRDGDHYVLSGQKVFITNGQNADLIIVACKTDRAQGAKGMSLLVVETEGVDGEGGFRRGRLLDKLGMRGQDTSELFFDGVRVPAANLLGGQEGG
jgi:acyl-CoA dehydrogenase